MLTFGYAGSRGNKILVAGNAIDTNGPSGCVGGSYTIGCGPGGTPFISPYTPPGGNAILEFGDLGRTTYNSLQIKAETKSTRHGIYALIAYTYSHTYDNGLSDGLGSEVSFDSRYKQIRKSAVRWLAREILFGDAVGIRVHAAVPAAG